MSIVQYNTQMMTVAPFELSLRWKYTTYGARLGGARTNNAVSFNSALGDMHCDTILSLPPC
jgi:hypothetical protein